MKLQWLKINSLLAVSLALTGCGTSGSAPVRIVSAAAPSIIAQPASQTVTVGQTATFSVFVMGTTPFTYQWQQGTAAIAGEPPAPTRPQSPPLPKAACNSPSS